MSKSALIRLNFFRIKNKIDPLGLIFSRHISSAASNRSSLTSESSNRNQNVRIFTSVCIERLPVITCDMNELEQRYSNLINEINIRKSYLSNHELRHLKDVERAAKKKISKESNQEEEDLIIETALDFEDRCSKELKSIKLGERKLESNYENKIQELEKQQSISYLKNVDHILDKKLILLVNDKNSFGWQLPALEWQPNDSSLRITAERSIKSLTPSDQLKVKFLGNAPVGVYKIKRDDHLQKYYFFKAQYKSGGELLAKSSDLDSVWIRKDELKYFIKNKDYLESIQNFILEF